MKKLKEYYMVLTLQTERPKSSAEVGRRLVTPMKSTLDAADPSVSNNERKKRKTNTSTL